MVIVGNSTSVRSVNASQDIYCVLAWKVIPEARPLLKPDQPTLGQVRAAICRMEAQGELYVATKRQARPSRNGRGGNDIVNIWRILTSEPQVLSLRSSWTCQAPLSGSIRANKRLTLTAGLETCLDAVRAT